MIKSLPNLFFIPVLLCMALMFFSVPGSIAGLEMANFLLFAILVIRHFFNVITKKDKVFTSSGFDTYFFLMWVWLVLSTALSSFEVASLHDAFVAGRFALVFFILFAVFRMYPTQFQIFRPLFHLHVLWIAVYGITQAFVGFDFTNMSSEALLNTEVVRTKGFFSNTMTYSYVFGMWYCFFTAYLILTKKRDLRYWLLAICTTVVGVSLIFTLTRGMWISLAATCGLVILLAGGLRGNRFLLGLIALGLTVMVSVPSIRARVLSVADLSHQSNSMRLEIWGAHFELAKENIWLGTGRAKKYELLEKSYKENPKKYNIVSHAHNNYLDVLSSNGIIGLVLYLLLFGSVYIHSLKLFYSLPDGGLKKLALASIAGQSFFHIGGLTECTFLDYEVVYSLIIIIAMLLGTARGKLGDDEYLMKKASNA